MARGKSVRLFGLAAGLGGAMGLAALIVLAAPPPPPARPHPRVPPGVRRPLAHRPAKPLVVPKPQPLVVHRTGPAVVVKQGATVIREGPPQVVIKTVENLPPVSRVETAKAAAYKVVDIGENYVITVEADGQKTPVRLLGVAPVQAADGERPPPLARMASRFVRNLLIGEFVCLEYDDNVAEQDEDGQAVAYVYRAPDGLLVNLEVIRQGFGLTDSSYAFEEQKTFRAYEEKAQADDKGLWGMLKEGPPGPRARPARED